MIDIDPKDREILSVLEKDGRISNIELAKQVGLSPSATLRRVQELEKSKAIRSYKAVLDPSVRGISLVAFVMVGLSDHLKKGALEFERAMDKSELVRECHNITGTIEYLLRVEVSDLEAYKTFHHDVLGTLPQVSSITTHISLGSSKDKRA